MNAEGLAELEVNYTKDYHDILEDDEIEVILIASSTSIKKAAADAVKTDKYIFSDIREDNIDNMLKEHLYYAPRFSDKFRNYREHNIWRLSASE